MTPTMTAAELVALANTPAGRECWPRSWQEEPWLLERLCIDEVYRSLLGGAVLRLGEVEFMVLLNRRMASIQNGWDVENILTACIAAIAAGMEGKS